MLKNIFFIILFSVSSLAKDTGVALHPEPKDPIYLQQGLYQTFKAQIPASPTAGSTAQKEDEKELFHLQKIRTAKDCQKAKAEVYVSLGSFYGGDLDPVQVQKLTAFFEQVRNDGDFFIQKMKKDFPRQRPFLYIKELNPCVPKEVTGAYPSGHATLSRLYALILSDFFPAQKDKLEKRANEIGKHRVLSGMHHPSDISSGQKLGSLIFAELKKSKKYLEAFEAEKAKLEPML